jgi:Ca2+-binding RTX toxin-like protein
MAFSGPPIPVTPVNTYTDGEQTHSAIAGLAGGGHVVAWSSAQQDGSDGGIYAQLFDADGNPTGGEFLVNTTTADNQDFPDIAALTGGDFVITWTSLGQDGDSNGVYMQRYTSAGVPLGGETLVNTTTTGGQGDAQVVALADGGFAVVWADSSGDGSLRLQRYDAAGLAVNGEVVVIEASDNSETPIWTRITEMASGRLAVVWTTQPNATEGNALVQLVNDDGTLSGGPIQMNTTPGTQSAQTQVVALPGGGFMALWVESVGTTGAVGVGDARIVGRIYRNSGTPVTDEFTVSEGTTGRRFNLLGDEVYVSDLAAQSGINRFLDLATLDNGDVMASWQTWLGTSDIVTRYIFTDREDARVTDAADTVTLANGGDTLSSLDGDDSITGGNGDDVMHGADGKDTLNGQSGNDWLDGAKGGDSLYGGSDNDTVKGGDGSDSISGGGGDDLLAGEADNDTIEGSSGNDSMFGGGGADELSGGSDNDTIWGDANPYADWTEDAGGNDVMDGGDGDDLMYGGTGDDTMEGGEGTDTLYGDGFFGDGIVPGNDTFILSAGADTANGLDGIDTLDLSTAGTGVSLTMNAYGNNLGIYDAGAGWSGGFYYIERFLGSDFNDTLNGDAEGNDFAGDDGDDSLTGNEGDDTLAGDKGNDILLGGADNDVLDGGKDDDVLSGGLQHDTLDGGKGNDSRAGGKGKDEFVFLDGYGADTVVAYAQGTDRVTLDEDLWGGGLTVDDVLATYGTLSATGRTYTLDFGAGDILVLRSAVVFDVLTLADDFSF